MNWLRKLLTLMGLTRDARVNIRAPGIDVTILGDPDRVRQMLGVVKNELERTHRRRRADSRARTPLPAGSVPAPVITTRDSQVVRPAELDEMDSPYAIPEHHPVDDPPEPTTDDPDALSTGDLVTPESADLRDTTPAMDAEIVPERVITAVDMDAESVEQTDPNAPDPRRGAP